METQLSAPKRTTSSWVQAMVWLIVALIFGVITILFWMASSAPTMQPDVTAQADNKKAQMSMDFNKITHVDNLNELRKEVKPISFDALVRDLRQYPDEFKDRSYFKQHEKDWTVQVMDVAEHEVITAYLDKRVDREKFAYLRYRDENDQPRYILTYDALNTPQLAMGTAKMVDFNLPNNIRVLPEEMSRYLSVIDNYELSEPVENVNLNPSYYVRLKPAKEEIPPKSELDEDSEAQGSGEEGEDLGSQPSIEESTDSSDVLALNETIELSAGGDVLDSEPADDATNSTAPAPTDSQAPSNPSPLTSKQNSNSSDASSSNANNSNNSNNSNSSANNSKPKPSTVKPTASIPSNRPNNGANSNNKPSNVTNNNPINNPVNRVEIAPSNLPKPVPPTDKEDADALKQLIEQKID